MNPESRVDGPLDDRRILWVALAIAIVARIAFLDAQSLTMDEVTELSIARQGLGDILVDPDGFPPLYHFILHFWMEIFGNGASRWLSAAFGVGAVAATWQLARVLAGVRVANWSALLLAVMPFHIWYSQESRAYSLYIFAAALSLWLFFRARKSGAARDWAWFVVAAVAGVYTHYFFGIVLAVLAALVLVEDGLARRSRGALASFGAIAAGSIPALFLLRGDMAYDFASYGVGFGPGQLAYTYLSFLTGYSIGPSVRELHTLQLGPAVRDVVPWLPVLALGAGTLAWVGIRAARRRGQATRLVVLGVLPVLLVGGLAFVVGEGYKVRYVSWVVVPIAVWLAFGIDSGIARWPGKAALVLLLAVLLVGRGNRVFNDRYREEDTRALAERISACQECPRSVLVSAGYMTTPILHYMPEGWSVRPLPDVAADGSGLDEALEIVRREIRSGDGAWFVYTRPFHSDPGGHLREALDPVLNDERVFAGVEVYLVPRAAASPEGIGQ